MTAADQVTAADLESDEYDSMPFAVSRYQKAPGEVYGRSPALDAMPSIKLANGIARTLAIQGENAVDPPLLVSDERVIQDGATLLPGALIYGGVDANGRRTVKPLEQGNLREGDARLIACQEDIKQMFSMDLFQHVASSPGMTAREVMQISAERMGFFSPPLGRIESELIGPLVQQELRILLDMGVLRYPPTDDEPYEVMFSSPMALARKGSQAAGLFSTLEAASGVISVTGDPTILDVFDFDIALERVANINGVPPSMLRGAEEVAQLRAARAQQAQAQQLADALPGMAGMIKATGGSVG